LEQSKNDLQDKSWTMLESLYNSAGAPTFRKWVQQNQPYYKRGGPLVANRLEQHNDILCRFFHSEFSKVLIPLFPEPVKPSYSYLGIYHDEACLPKHTDREQCQWNVSVVLDSFPEINTVDDSWPIFLEPAPDECIPLKAIIGDAIVYRGTRIPHWRE